VANDLSECGWPHLDVAPLDYRRAAGLITCYMRGEGGLFDEILNESGPAVLAAAVEAASVALALLADESRRPRSVVLQDFCGFVAHFTADQP